MDNVHPNAHLNADSNGRGSPGRARGVLPYAALVVLVIIVVAAVAILAARRGGMKNPSLSRTLEPRGRRPATPSATGTGTGTVEFSGATRVVRTLLKDAKCHPGHVPVLVGGSIEAYTDPLSHVPCGRVAITRPTPATSQNLRRLEDEASESCPARAGWYVVHSRGVCPDASEDAERLDGGQKEGFYWAEGDGTTERENYSGQRRRRREGFSPDAPGACSRCNQPGLRRAAELEASALEVAMGN